MELLIKLAEEASAKPELSAPKKLSTYTSVYKVDGLPILPPLMTPDRRMEMNHHRLTALGIENYLLDKTQRLPLSMPKSIDCLKNGSRDVSTNTDLQPLVVMGRFRQELQQSETLIYDNRCNAIIKPLKVRREVKSSASRITTARLIIEEQPMALAQMATIQYSPPQFSIMKTLCLPPPSTSQRVAPTSLKNPRLSCQKVNSEYRSKADQGQKSGSILDLLNVAKKMQRNMLSNEFLQRSNTSPILKNGSNLNRIQGVNRTKSTERLDKLHPQLWQRDATKNCLIPKSPSNARAIESSLPSSIASSSTNDLTKQEQEHEQDSIPVKKIMVKQCMTKEQPLRFRKPKPSASKNLILNSNSNSNSNSQRVAASPIQQNSHGPMNSVQRRLNYDPRASLRRNAPSKRMEESTENDAKAGPKLELSLPLNDIQADGVTDKILEMERQQRQRFQLLVAKQANEQKRLQDEFEMQQQALRDRILNDFNSLGMADEDMVEGEGGSENNH
ncbi:uncharacterized protein LOC6651172 [Drosophila willistoni]|uniref:uncharacterized protein LOC6651172 n=1 Tax=Drosophila willistoni TaxID=7260 RepID=UPI000C26DA18|nr:uncharacterized protein LOC6651172 [Drosophila willistoni]